MHLLLLVWKVVHEPQEMLPNKCQEMKDQLTQSQVGQWEKIFSFLEAIFLKLISYRKWRIVGQVSPHEKFVPLLENANGWEINKLF